MSTSCGNFTKKDRWYRSICAKIDNENFNLEKQNRKSKAEDAKQRRKQKFEDKASGK